MEILMAPKAFWHLQWLCKRSANEVSGMGILSPQAKVLTVTDVLLVKQEVSTVHVSLDMEWWAEKQIDLYEREGIQPWQTSLWLHTHPQGMKGPSSR